MSVRILLVAALLSGAPFTAAPAGDCNRNGVPDLEEVEGGSARDCDRNQNPDECDVAPVNLGLVPASSAAAGQMSAVVTVDLDGDGRLDLLGASPEGRELAALRNEGRALFPVTEYVPLTDRPRDLAAADLDGDGRPDAAATVDFGVRVLRNDGHGVLAEASRVALHQGPAAIRAGDLDGDGDIDLLTLNPGGANVSVLANDGAGRFASPRNYAAGDQPSVLFAADLDGDGDRDALVGQQRSPNLVVLDNDGQGALWTGNPLIANGNASWIAGGDLDRDGDLDLVIATSTGTQVLLRREGAFHTRAGDLPGDPETRYALSVQDVNGDGLLDLVRPAHLPARPGYSVSALTIFTNQGGAAFAPEAFRATTGGTAFASGDLDGDGSDDLVAASPAGLSILLSRLTSLSEDCDADGIPDSCGLDCDHSGVPDACELAAGVGADCNQNGVLDRCDPDCNRNDVPDECELAADASGDCNSNEVLDECELDAAGRQVATVDCDGNGVLDACEIRDGSAADCDANGVPDPCDLSRPPGFHGHERLPFPGAREVAALDLDGDGAVEILAAGEAGLAVFPGRPAGRFAPLRLLSPAPSIFTTADLDGDGDLDIAASETAGAQGVFGLAVHLQERDRSFAPAPVHAGDRLFALAAGDFDGDGREDLAAAAGAILVFRGLGGGGFASPRRVEAGASLLAASDLDGDGDLDLAASAWEERGSVFRNDGGLSFAAAGTFVAGGARFLASDLDLDGDVELASARGNLNWNEGRGTFTPGGRPQAGDGHTSIPEYALAAADADGDGDPELFIAIGSMLKVERNDGARTFSTASSLSLGAASQGLAAADLNADGLADLVAAQSTAGVSVLLNLGDPASFGMRTVPLGGRSVNGLGYWEDPGPLAGALDLDGDQDLDLLVEMGWTGILALHENEGDGRFRAPVELEARAAQGAMLVADLDGDGDEDVAIGDRRGTQVTVHRDEGASLGPAVSFPAGSWVRALAALDVEGDGDLDVATAAKLSGPAAVLVNDGSGGFAPPRRLDVSPEQGAIAAGDLDGDGDDDVVLGARLPDTLAGTLAFFLNDGRGELPAGGALAVEGIPTAAEVADLDGDGRLDFVLTQQVTNSSCSWGCLIDGRASILWNDGEGALREAAVARSWVPIDVEVHDFDGDGDLDVAYPNTWSFQFDYWATGTWATVLWNQGERRFVAENLVVGEDPHTVLGADLDGSGGGDLIVVTRESASILLARPRDALRDRDRDGILDACEDGPSFRRGDFNADGRLDIADAIGVLRHLFAGGPRGTCFQAADADDGGSVNLTDPIVLLVHLFAGGGPLPEPSARCGLDSTPDALSCEEFAPCAG